MQLSPGRNQLCALGSECWAGPLNCPGDGGRATFMIELTHTCIRSSPRMRNQSESFAKFGSRQKHFRKIVYAGFDADVPAALNTVGRALIQRVSLNAGSHAVG